MDEYRREIECLKSLGREWELSLEELDNIFQNSISYFDRGKTKKLIKGNEKYLNMRQMISALVLICLLLSTIYMHRKSIQNIVERNVQEIIYPGMKLFRKLMLPIIETFPSLTEWYDENCLVRNPYFQVSDIDCWPCANVRSVLNLTGNNIGAEHYHSGIPFIYKENQLKHVDFKRLQNMYIESKEMFDQHSSRIELTGSGTWQTVEEFLWSSAEISGGFQDSHITWKLNRLEPTRAARHAFGFPRQIPYYASGAALEKFILIDGAHAAPYSLPVTEGSTVLIIQGSGSRLLVLDPAPECKTECHRVSLVLQPQHILWYNWWYWRASSFPISTTQELSVAYVGSYY